MIASGYGIVKDPFGVYNLWKNILGDGPITDEEYEDCMKMPFAVQQKYLELRYKVYYNLY